VFIGGAAREWRIRERVRALDAKCDGDKWRNRYRWELVMNTMSRIVAFVIVFFRAARDEAFNTCAWRSTERGALLPLLRGTCRNMEDSLRGRRHSAPHRDSFDSLRSRMKHNVGDLYG